MPLEQPPQPPMRSFKVFYPSRRRGPQGDLDEEIVERQNMYFVDGGVVFSNGSGHAEKTDVLFLSWEPKMRIEEIYGEESPDWSPLEAFNSVGSGSITTADGQMMLDPSGIWQYCELLETYAKNHWKSPEHIPSFSSLSAAWSAFVCPRHGEHKVEQRGDKLTFFGQMVAAEQLDTSPKEYNTCNRCEQQIERAVTKQGDWVHTEPKRAAATLGPHVPVPKFEEE